MPMRTSENSPSMHLSSSPQTSADIRMRSISKQNLGTLRSSTSASTTSLSTSITRAKAKASVATLNAGSTPGKRKRSSVHLPSAPNGAALAPQPEEVRAPDAKKKRLSYLGSLADAGRSMLSLGESEKGAGKGGKKVTPKRRPSILPGELYVILQTLR
jgi:hypothetical protein